MLGYGCISVKQHGYSRMGARCRDSKYGNIGIFVLHVAFN